MAKVYKIYTGSVICPPPWPQTLCQVPFTACQLLAFIALQIRGGSIERPLESGPPGRSVDRRFDAARSLLALVLGDCGARAAWVRRGSWGFAFYFGGRSGNQQSREGYAVCGGEFGDYVSPFGVGQVGQKVGNHRQPGSVGVSQRWDVRIGFGGLCTGFCTASFRNCPIF